MSAFFTIISGVLVFVLGQFVLKLLIEPIQAYKTTVGEISVALIFHSNVFANPGVLSKDANDLASKEFRTLASKLSAQVFLIPFYDKTADAFRLPTKDQIHEVKSILIFLSNNLHTRGHDVQGISPGELNSRKAESISKLLRIYVPEDSKVYRPNPDA